MPKFQVELSNFQIDTIQVGLEAVARMAILNEHAAMARFLNSFTKQLGEIERDPENKFAGPMGEVVWPDNPVVTQVE